MKKMLGIALLLALSTGGVAFAHSHGEFEASSAQAAKSGAHHNQKTIGHEGHKAGMKPTHQAGTKGHTHGAAKSKS